MGGHKHREGNPRLELIEGYETLLQLWPERLTRREVKDERLRGELFVERHLLHLKRLEGLSVDAGF